MKSAKNMHQKTAIIGGGAAGFFLAINLKEKCPKMEITIFERSQKVLAKVEISGGGRCNCTNSFASVSDLKTVYPRGHRLLKRLFKSFGPQDAYAWFEQHGVRLTTQDDECVFPTTQDSHTIINCFLNEARRHGVEVRTGECINDLNSLNGYNYIAVTTGGSPRAEGLRWLEAMGHDTVAPVPSLYTFQIDDPKLHELMGTVAEDATVLIPGTKFKAYGPLLITHWGTSGPAVLKLSSYAARLLAEHQYTMPMAVNWVSRKDEEIREELLRLKTEGGNRQIGSLRPFNLTTRLWNYLAAKGIGERVQGAWASLNQKELNRLLNVLTNDNYQICGRAAFKDEFVTCGGISLSSVNPATLESKIVPHLYFAGEVLDIDGVTGGFNFQAAWTTAYTIAEAISQNCQRLGI